MNTIYLHPETLKFFADRKLTETTSLSWTVEQMKQFFATYKWVIPEEQYDEAHGRFLADINQLTAIGEFYVESLSEYLNHNVFSTIQGSYVKHAPKDLSQRVLEFNMNDFVLAAKISFLDTLAVKIFTVEINEDTIDFNVLKPNAYAKLNGEVVYCETLLQNNEELIIWKRLPYLYEESNKVSAEVIKEFGKKKTLFTFIKENHGKLHDLLPYVPDVDDTFVIREDYFDFVKLFTQKGFHKILLTGDPGVGKSELASQICARMNLPCMRVDFSGETTPDQFLWSVDFDKQAGGLIVKEGMLPFCLRNGIKLIIEEFSAIPPSVAFELHRVFEKGYLFIKDNQTLIEPHPMFSIVMTDNRIGNPNFGKFSGTMQQNQALISRIEAAIWVDYPTKQDELEMLNRKFPQLAHLNVINDSSSHGSTKNLFSAIIDFATDVRKMYRARSLSFTISPREVVYFLKNFLTLTDLNKAFDYSVLNFNKAFENDVVMLRSTFKVAFGETPKIDQMQPEIVREADIYKLVSDGVVN